MKVRLRIRVRARLSLVGVWVGVWVWVEIKTSVSKPARALPYTAPSLHPPSSSMSLIRITADPCWSQLTLWSVLIPFDAYWSLLITADPYWSLLTPADPCLEVEIVSSSWFRYDSSARRQTYSYFFREKKNRARTEKTRAKKHSRNHDRSRFHVSWPDVCNKWKKYKPVVFFMLLPKRWPGHDFKNVSKMRPVTISYFQKRWNTIGFTHIRSWNHDRSRFQLFRSRFQIVDKPWVF